MVYLCMNKKDWFDTWNLANKGLLSLFCVFLLIFPMNLFMCALVGACLLSVSWYVREYDTFNLKTDGPESFEEEWPSQLKEANDTFSKNKKTYHLDLGITDIVDDPVDGFSFTSGGFCSKRVEIAKSKSKSK